MYRKVLKIFHEIPSQIYLISPRDTIYPYDAVFYVVRASPMLADKLYYEAPVVVLNCCILRYKMIVTGRV